MSDAVLLNLVLFLPVVGAALLALARRNAEAVRVTTTAIMTVQFALAAVLYLHFDGTMAGLQAGTSIPWIPQWGVSYAVGLDGVNILLVLLTAFLGPLVVLGAWTAIKKDVALFHVNVLLLQFAMMGAFLAQDLFLFYLFWDCLLYTSDAADE